jgi:hypothetical protein
MFCAQCGKPALDDAISCSHCGALLPSLGWAPKTAASASGSAPADEPASGRLVFDVRAGGRLRRVREILLAPATEWPVVAAEPSPARSIYLGYVAPLVAIGVVAAFLGHSFVGLPLIGRIGVGAALAHAVFSYALAFVGVYVIALIVDLLAPSFGGKRDPLAALKVTAYSFTPAWVAGIFNLIPILGVLTIVGALYGLYLLYLGLPVLMRCPAERAVGYTIVTVLCAIVTWIVIAALTTCAVGGLGLIGVGALRGAGG